MSLEWRSAIWNWPKLMTLKSSTKKRVTGANLLNRSPNWQLGMKIANIWLLISNETVNQFIIDLKGSKRSIPQTGLASDLRYSWYKKQILHAWVYRAGNLSHISMLCLATFTYIPLSIDWIDHRNFANILSSKTITHLRKFKQREKDISQYRQIVKVSFSIWVYHWMLGMWCTFIFETMFENREKIPHHSLLVFKIGSP